MISALSIFAAGWLLGFCFPWRWPAPGLRALLERARFDLERGWNAAALDSIGRALRLLAAPPKESSHVD